MAHKEGRGAWHQTSIRRPDGFSYNFAIACVVVPSWLALLKWHAGDLRLG